MLMMILCVFYCFPDYHLLLISPLTEIHNIEEFTFHIVGLLCNIRLSNLFEVVER